MAKYEIIIRTEGESKGGASKNIAGGGKEKHEPSLSDLIDDQTKRIVNYATIYTAKNLVASKVGEQTRNNILQQKIDYGMEFLETAAAFIVNPVYGAVKLGLNIASKSIDYNLAVSKEKNRLSVDAERAGYVNRSR